MPRDRTLSIATFFYPITAHGVNDGYSITDITYDGLGRLTATTGNPGAGNSAMRYDGLGNIRYYQHKKHTLTYAYDNNNRLTFIDSPQKPYDQFYYDDRGNVTDNSYHQFTYNRANQLAVSGSNSYIYDGYNRRVVAQEGSKTSYSVYSQSGQLLHTKSAEGGVNYIYLNKKLIAKDGVVPRNSAKQHYLPFGGSIEGEKNDVGYTGHKFDTALNLSYMQARYYDPAIGRFYSNDPIGFTGDVATFNRYSYVGNDPVNAVDPSGMATSLVVNAFKIGRAGYKHRSVSGAVRGIGREIAYDWNQVGSGSTATAGQQLGSAADLILGTAFNESAEGTRDLGDLEPIHDADHPQNDTGIGELSDGELGEAINNPENGDRVTVRGNKVLDGNTRVNEAKGRGWADDTKIPVVELPELPDNVNDDPLGPYR